MSAKEKFLLRISSAQAVPGAHKGIRDVHAIERLRELSLVWLGVGPAAKAKKPPGMGAV